MNTKRVYNFLLKKASLLIDTLTKKDKQGKRRAVVLGPPPTILLDSWRTAKSSAIGAILGKLADKKGLYGYTMLGGAAGAGYGVLSSIVRRLIRKYRLHDALLIISDWRD